MKTFFRSQLIALTLLTGSAMTQAMPVEMSFDDIGHPEVNHYLRQTFGTFFNNPEAMESELSDDFVQVFGGKINSRADFLAHVSVLQQSLTGAKIRFEDVSIDKDGVISEIHTIALNKKDGSEAVLRFLAFYYFKDGKLSKVDELSAVVQGSSEDRDLGSRIK
ncbi:SnoaL-like protein [Sinobacterium caligoides]|uniref:SnoaL-like protein n=1 Tax=Sinobacterium caligoides TaxID=933926 RepID=A0A3N2DPR1_9GAMM|nr:nuclear transport factor 2 family protein [Sinobacterium caligoides]ROS01770.1 SnoaL-like protein [Sinobacterium caligoides]